MTDYAEVLTEAHAKAGQAIRDAVAISPEKEGDSCGFAWVSIDGRSPLANFCRRMNKGSAEYPKGWHGERAERGWEFWEPGWHRGQAMRLHLVGAVAFAVALAEYGIRADVGSRLD